MERSEEVVEAALPRRRAKDYDWSHLAARYFPDARRREVPDDPSLAVAHGCFWKYHPAKAYAWELRLQDESAPTSPSTSPTPTPHRTRFLEDRAPEARALEAAEHKRRERKAAKADAETEEPDVAGGDDDASEAT